MYHVQRCATWRRCSVIFFFSFSERLRAVRRFRCVGASSALLMLVEDAGRAGAGAACGGWGGGVSSAGCEDGCGRLCCAGGYAGLP